MVKIKFKFHKMGRIGTVGRMSKTTRIRFTALVAKHFYRFLQKLFLNRDKSCESTPGGCKLGVPIRPTVLIHPILRYLIKSKD